MYYVSIIVLYYVNNIPLKFILLGLDSKWALSSQTEFYEPQPRFLGPYVLWLYFLMLYYVNNIPHTFWAWILSSQTGFYEIQNPATDQNMLQYFITPCSRKRTLGFLRASETSEVSFGLCLHELC